MSPTATTNSPTPTPTPTPTPAGTALDLSTVDPAAAGTYDSATKSLLVKNVADFRFKLAKTVNSGESLEVKVKGTAASAVGFRSWLVDGSYTTLANIVKSSDLGITTGNFDVTYTLVSTGAGAYLYFKGPAYGTNIDNLTIQSITVTSTGTVAKTEAPNPYKPAVEQDPATTSLTLAKSFKEASGGLGGNPLIGQDFTADPTAIEDNGRLYVFATHDVIEFDSSGNAVTNGYNTSTLYCLSSADLVNWTDHGMIDVKKVTTWASKSWAPSVTSKMINGTRKFFLYFTNGGDGIGVLTAESPLGPWSDPIGKKLISRSTPTCSEAEVPWLFDPGVLLDDDGTGYLYFGGGNPATQTKANPKSGRVVKLAADMVTLDGAPAPLDPYYYFEDNEINKINGKYYYSYCTNWSFTNNGACIAYMTSDSPMSGFTYQGIILKNPGTYFGNFYNNHHKMVQFQGAWYILYHSTLLEEKVYGTKMGYRSLHLDKMTVGADGVPTATGTYTGPGAVATLDALKSVNATTMAWSAGLRTAASTSKPQMVLDAVNTGDWFGVQNADFGSAGAKGVKLSLASTATTGGIEVWIDGPSTSASGTKVATVALPNTGSTDTFTEATATLSQTVTGVHKVYFVLRGVGYRIASWQFVP